MATAAAKKAPAKKVAAKEEPAAKTPAKKTGTALVDWQEALAAKAKFAKKVVANVGGGARNTLSFKGGKITYQGGTVPGNALRVVVISAINENNFFDGRYDPNNPSSPSCYAFGDPTGEDENMGPNPKFVPAEKMQSETGRCADCANNEWGSADTGRGKACKNVVSLAMITEDALESEEAIAKAEVVYAKLPVTSGKSWKGFVNDCGDKHYMQFVTELSVTATGETYTIDFEAQEEVDPAVMGALVEKSDKEDRKWGTEAYPVFEAPPPQQRGARRQIPIKTAPAKKVAAKPRKF